MKSKILASFPDPKLVADWPASAVDRLRDGGIGAFEALADALPQIVWSGRPDGYCDYFNARWYEFTGAPAGSTDGDTWRRMIHPEDRSAVASRLCHSLATGESLEIEFRLRAASGDFRWTIGRAAPLRDADGRVVRWLGTCTDIHEAKRAAEQNALLSRELSHRIKNIFAVVGSLVRLSSRAAPEAADFAGKLEERIAALGRAHEFVRPRRERSPAFEGPSMLHATLLDLLGAYRTQEAGRLTVLGEDCALGEEGAAPLALVFHELATNAAKYGALSVAEGTVAIHTRCENETVHLSWREEGGPELEGEPGHSGFGTRLVQMSIERQLGGEIRYDWRKQGLAVDMTVPAASLNRL